MKAKKATQQKMHHGNSWGNGKQRLEELFKLTRASSAEFCYPILE